MNLFSRTLVAAAIAALIASPGLAQEQTQPPSANKRPNIVIILGDDMGFADMGSFGSEINTPNLDSLADDGVRFTNFYTHAASQRHGQYG